MIEEVLERIVMALEERNVLQKRMVECAEWQVKRLSEKTESPAAPAPAAEAPAPVAPAAEAPVAPAPAAPEAEDPALDREALLKECKELGVEVPAKTRTTTLAKLVAEARVKVPEAIKAEEKALEQEMEEAAKPDPVKPLTSAEARAILNKEYDGSERDRNILREALKCVNATKFCEVQEGQFDDVVKVFLTIKKEAVKNA